MIASYQKEDGETVLALQLQIPSSVREAYEWVWGRSVTSDRRQKVHFGNWFHYERSVAEHGMVVPLIGEGSPLVAREGDYIIRHAQGYFSVCDGIQFPLLYAMVRDA